MNSTTVTHQALGAHGEAIAAHYLQAKGFHILARNWRCRNGELDLVAREGSAIVAVEVKTRSNTGYGNPLEAITARKLARLRNLLADWLRHHETSAATLRIDAIGILFTQEHQALIDHLRGVS